MISGTDQSSWRLRLRAALAMPHAREADHTLAELAYEVLGTSDPETIDMLMAVFTQGLDSSLLQSYVNALGSVPFDAYCSAYARNLPVLLEKAPRWAVSLLDYPGGDMSEADCAQLVAAVLDGEGGPALLDSIGSLIEQLRLSSDHPWGTVLRLPRRRKRG
jgi:hypothetical protein